MSREESKKLMRDETRRCLICNAVLIRCTFCGERQCIECGWAEEENYRVKELVPQSKQETPKTSREEYGGEPW